MNENLPLARQLISILAANREDSHATQRKRAEHLGNVAEILHCRFGLQKWDNLRQKHVDEIVRTWKFLDKGHRTIEGKLSNLRWLLHKIGKPNLLPRSNAELGIEPGPRYTRAGKTVADEELAKKLALIADLRVRAMIGLARHVGLRFKEACLFRPGRDFDGTRVWVKRGSKGGRPRYLLIHDARQVAAIGEARLLTTADSGLIPAGYATFEKWRQYVYGILRDAGISRETDSLFHDLRRTYLVERMHFLVDVRHLSPDDAAKIVAREAGHNRTEVLAWYLEALPAHSA